jgi:23S rRNA pseudouridine1911/1915/1917 synthase
MTSEIKSYKVKENLNGQRFDLAAVELSGLSRKKIRQTIDSGGAFLNKKRIWIAKYQVKVGDVLELRAEEKQAKTEQGVQKGILSKQHIIFDDVDFLVINKPSGVSVDSSKITIFSYLQEILSGQNLNQFALANRLDKDTSGLLIITKNPKAESEFRYLFSNRKVNKTYRVISFDTPETEKGLITYPIIQHSKGKNQYFAVTDEKEAHKGKSAETSFTLLDSFVNKRISYLECQPKTGRSHQIRVHLRAIGNPVLGDKLYASHLGHHPFFQIASRQMLHSYKLNFVFREKEYNLKAQLPEDMSKLLSRLKSGLL